MSPDLLNKAIELYSDRLLTLGYLELPKFYQPSSFKERIDASLINLIQLCSRLNTLVSFFSSTCDYLFIMFNDVLLFLYRLLEKKYLRARCC